MDQRMCEKKMEQSSDKSQSEPQVSTEKCQFHATVEINKRDKEVCAQASCHTPLSCEHLMVEALGLGEVWWKRPEVWIFIISSVVSIYFSNDKRLNLIQYI